MLNSDQVEISLCLQKPGGAKSSFSFIEERFGVAISLKYPKQEIGDQANNTVNFITRLPVVGFIFQRCQSPVLVSGVDTEATVHGLSLCCHLCLESLGLPVLPLADVTLLTRMVKIDNY